MQFYGVIFIRFSPIRKAARKIIAAVAACAFLCSTLAVGQDLQPAAAIAGKASGQDAFIQDTPGFEIPFHLGSVTGIHIGTNGKTVIHIQDAHCKFSCQKSIAGIIDYLHKTRGVSFAALEGGAGDYDLSVFTEIRDKEVRERTALYFVKEGRISGAEYFAVNNPYTFGIKGLEDAGLYVENLKTYRHGLQYGADFEEAVSILEASVENLKKHIYSGPLKEFDSRRTGYDEKEVNFSQYVAYLRAESARLGIDAARYPNVVRLARIIGGEKGIDFRAADAERASLLDDLAKYLSSRDMEKLITETLRLKQALIPEAGFYKLLFEKASIVKIDAPSRYPTLAKYVNYITAYEALDDTGLLDEVRKLENEIAARLCVNNDQAKIYDIGNYLRSLRRMAGLSVTAEEYMSFKADMGGMSAGGIVDFIREEYCRYGLDACLPDDLPILDAYARNMEKFYEQTFERDRAFLNNIDGYAAGREKLVVVTGGFHSGHLLKLLEDAGYSYVTIVPGLDAGEESPYMKVLSGGKSGIENMLEPYVSAIAVPAVMCDMLVRLGAVSPDERGRFERAAGILAALEEYGAAHVVTRDGTATLTRDGSVAGAQNLGRLDDRDLFAVRGANLREVVDAGETSVSFDFDGGVQPITPLAELTTSDIGNMLTLIAIVKIAAAHDVNPVDLFYYILSRGNITLSGRQQAIAAGIILLMDSLRRTGAFYETMTADVVNQLLSSNIPPDSVPSFSMLKALEKRLRDRSSPEFRNFIDSLVDADRIISPTTGYGRYPLQSSFAREHALPELIRSKLEQNDRRIHITSIGCSVGVDLLEMGCLTVGVLEGMGEDPGVWTIILEGQDISHTSLERLEAETFANLPAGFRFDVRTRHRILGYDSDVEELSRERYDVIILRTTMQYVRPTLRGRINQALNASFLFVDGDVAPPAERYERIFPEVFQEKRGPVSDIRLDPAQIEAMITAYRLDDSAATVYSLSGQRFPLEYIRPLIGALHEEGIPVQVDGVQVVLSYLQVEAGYGREGLMPFDEYMRLYLPFRSDFAIFTGAVHDLLRAHGQGGISAREFSNLLRARIERLAQTPWDNPFRLFSDIPEDDDTNVTCGTVCGACHEGCMGVLDDQLARFYAGLAGEAGISRDLSVQPLTSDEVIDALAMSRNIDPEILRAIRDHIKSEIPEINNRGIEILFAVPEGITDLWWVRHPETGEPEYAGGHFNGEGSRIHMSLPLLLSQGSQDEIKASATAIARHELGHILDSTHDADDEGMRIVREIAELDVQLFDLSGADFDVEVDAGFAADSGAIAENVNYAIRCLYHAVRSGERPDWDKIMCSIGIFERECDNPHGTGPDDSIPAACAAVVEKINRLRGAHFFYTVRDFPKVHILVEPSLKGQYVEPQLPEFPEGVYPVLARVTMKPGPNASGDIYIFMPDYMAAGDINYRHIMLLVTQGLLTSGEYWDFGSLEPEGLYDPALSALMQYLWETGSKHEMREYGEDERGALLNRIEIKSVGNIMPAEAFSERQRIREILRDMLTPPEGWPWHLFYNYVLSVFQGRGHSRGPIEVEIYDTTVGRENLSRDGWISVNLLENKIYINRHILKRGMYAEMLITDNLFTTERLRAAFLEEMFHTDLDLIGPKEEGLRASMRLAAIRRAIPGSSLLVANAAPYQTKEQRRLELVLDLYRRAIKARNALRGMEIRRLMGDRFRECFSGKEPLDLNGNPDVEHKNLLNLISDWYFRKHRREMGDDGALSFGEIMGGGDSGAQVSLTGRLITAVRPLREFGGEVVSADIRLLAQDSGVYYIYTRRDGGTVQCAGRCVVERTQFGINLKYFFTDEYASLRLSSNVLTGVSNRVLRSEGLEDVKNISIYIEDVPGFNVPFAVIHRENGESLDKIYALDMPRQTGAPMAMRDIEPVTYDSASDSFFTVMDGAMTLRIAKSLVDSEREATAYARRMAGILDVIADASETTNYDINLDLESLRAAAGAVRTFTIHAGGPPDTEIFSANLNDTMIIGLGSGAGRRLFGQIDDGDIGFMLINALLKKESMVCSPVSWVKKRITTILVGRILADYIFPRPPSDWDDTLVIQTSSRVVGHGNVAAMIDRSGDIAYGVVERGLFEKLPPEKVARIPEDVPRGILEMPEVLRFIAGENVTCGTICGACHEGCMGALDDQLARFYAGLAGGVGISRDIAAHPLTSDEVIDALGRTGRADAARLREIRNYVESEIPDLKGKIFFAVPETETDLWWVEHPGTGEMLYAAGHFSGGGTRVHISLPFLLSRGSLENVKRAAVAVARHEYRHITDGAHDQDDEGMRLAGGRAEAELEMFSAERANLPILDELNDDELLVAAAWLDMIKGRQVPPDERDRLAGGMQGICEARGLDSSRLRVIRPYSVRQIISARREDRERDELARRERTRRAEADRTARLSNMASRMIQDLNYLQLNAIGSLWERMRENRSRLFTTEFYNILRAANQWLPDIMSWAGRADMLAIVTEIIGTAQFAEAIERKRVRELEERDGAREEKRRRGRSVFDRIWQILHWTDPVYGEKAVAFLDALDRFYEIGEQGPLFERGGMLEYLLSKLAVRDDPMECISIDFLSEPGSGALSEECNIRRGMIESARRKLAAERERYEQSLGTYALTDAEEAFMAGAGAHDMVGIWGFGTVRAIPLEILKRPFRYDGVETTLMDLIMDFYAGTGFIMAPDMKTLNITFSEYEPDSKVISASRLADIYGDLKDYILSMPREIFDSLEFLPPILIEGGVEYGTLGAVTYSYIKANAEPWPGTGFDISISPPRSIRYWHEFGYHGLPARKIFNHEFLGHVLVFEAMREGVLDELVPQEDFGNLLENIAEVRTGAGVHYDYRLYGFDGHERHVAVDLERPIDDVARRVREAILLGVGPGASTPWELYHSSLREHIARQAETGYFCRRPYFAVRARDGVIRYYRTKVSDERGTIVFTPVSADELARARAADTVRREESVTRLRQDAVDDIYRAYADLEFDLRVLLKFYDRCKSGRGDANVSFNDMKTAAGSRSGIFSPYSRPDQLVSALDECGGRDRMVRAIDETVRRLRETLKREFVEELLDVYTGKYSPGEARQRLHAALAETFLNNPPFDRLASDLAGDLRREGVRRTLMEDRQVRRMLALIGDRDVFDVMLDEVFVSKGGEYIRWLSLADQQMRIHNRQFAAGRQEVRGGNWFQQEIAGLAAGRSGQLSVLDIGCGDGAYGSLELASSGCDYTAVDLSRLGLDDFRRKLAGRDSRNIKLINESIEDFLNRAPSGCYDVVHAHLSLHYFDDATTRRIFSQIRRVLKPGGALYAKVVSTEDRRFIERENMVSLEEENMVIFTEGARAGEVRRVFTEDYLAAVMEGLNISLLTHENEERGRRPLVAVGFKPLEDAADERAESLKGETLSEISGEMFGLLTREAGAVVEPCTIGVVIRARPDDAADLERCETLAARLNGFGEQLSREVQLKRRPGITEYAPGLIRYVIHIDDGTASTENIGRLTAFAAELGRTPRERNFAWILASDDRPPASPEYGEALAALGAAAHLVALRGDYAPVSWQMLVGPMFANLIECRRREEARPGVYGDAIGSLISAIVRSAARMTGTADLAWLRTALARTEGFTALFSGRLVLRLLDVPSPGSESAEDLRKADWRILRAL
ncbi:MAG: methyltransferase [Candidatus Omnitrophota bacterium]